MCQVKSGESLKPLQHEYFGGMLKFQTPIVWRNAIGILVLHIVCVWSFFNIFLTACWPSIIWGMVVGHYTGICVTAGAHRLWTHRTYKAKLPLRIFLMIGFISAGQYSLVQWARDHRLHHKHADTDADPHNANRGFFFSHCGWLMMKRHPQVKEKGKQIDLSDLWADPVVAFQQKYFIPLHLLLFIILPSAIPAIFWGEDLKTVIFGGLILRYCWQLNSTWIVNSVAHFYGYKPYNKHIRAVQNKIVSTITLGEGWHNYHHVFPWDYRTSEYGTKPNVSSGFIELCAKLGLAYDLKYASPEMIQKVIARTGGDPHYEAPDPEKLPEMYSDTTKHNTNLVGRNILPNFGTVMGQIRKRTQEKTL